MSEEKIKILLEQVKNGQLTITEGLEKLRYLPFEELDMAKVDHHRTLRQGRPEVIFGQGKTVEQISGIIDAMRKNQSPVLVTRLAAPQAETLLAAYSDASYHKNASCLTIGSCPQDKSAAGKIVVVSAGTSDMQVATEAAVTARFFGNQTEELFDVGVAGIHRLFASLQLLRSATVLIVVAGMEGALPSVIGGLVDCPVIAVPTSVGYGASFGGIAALLGMLNSCASGVSVVNIDNGFGAACAADRIIRKVVQGD